MENKSPLKYAFQMRKATPEKGRTQNLVARLSTRLTHYTSRHTPFSTILASKQYKETTKRKSEQSLENEE